MGTASGGVFRDVLKIASEAGLIKLGHVAVDGTKIEADAGRKSVHKKETLSGGVSVTRYHLLIT